MSFVPCYFCPSGRKRSDAQRRHCEKIHPNSTGVVTSVKNALGYVFHFLDGHTDRVWATCRGGESPTSVGHCFLCHTFIEKETYKTIELAVAAHVCNPELGKERAKRSGTHLSAHLPATGGAGTVTHSGPSVTVDEEFLLSKYKELGKTIEYVYDDDCNLRVKDSVELVFAKAFKAEDIFEKNKIGRAHV